MASKNQNWFKYVIVAAASVLVTVILLTIFVLIRLDSTLWQQYGWINSIRLIYDDFYDQGHIYWMVKGAVLVILIAALSRAVVAILPLYAQSVAYKEKELEKQKQELARRKAEVEAQAQELEEKREKYIDQVKNVETKCRKLEKRIGGLRGRIKQVADMLQEEQPQIGKSRSLLLKAYKSRGDKIEATDSELGRLRAENELLYAENAQLKESKVQIKKDMEELKEDVQDLQQDKKHLQNTLEKYIEPEKSRKKKRGR